MCTCMCMHVCVSVCVCMCVYPYVYACIYVCCICVYCYECVCAYACTYCGQPCRPTLQKSGTHMVSYGTDWSQSVHNSGLSSDCPGERDNSVKFTPLASGAVHTQWLPQVGVQRLGLFVLIQSNYKELPPLQRPLWYYIRWSLCSICIAPLTPSLGLFWSTRPSKPSGHKSPTQSMFPEAKLRY